MKITAYMRLFWPPAFRRLLKRIAQDNYHAGYGRGFDVGHRRGWMQLRSKVTRAPNKYPHEPEKAPADCAA